MTDEVSAGDAVVAIGEEGGLEAAGLVADLMARNAHDAAWTMEQLYLGEKARADRLQIRLDAVNDRLNKIHRRHDWLLGLTDDPDDIFYP